MGVGGRDRTVTASPDLSHNQPKIREVGLHAQRAQLKDGMDTDERNKQIGCKGCRQDHIMTVKGGVWRGYLGL